MSVREYIGARYVPLFSEPLEWTNQQTYEPLTIVLHEGNSYTSRQYVPLGIDIANEEFWALTGNYNAQVEAYRRETAAAVETANGAEATANAASEQANTNHEAIGVIDNKLAGTENSGLKELIDDIDTPIDVYMPVITGSCIICKIGDKKIIMDTGKNGDISKINSYLAENDINNVDYLVISHFHDDHCEAIDNIKDHLSENCRCFIQMEPGSSNSEYEKYIANKNICENALNSVGLHTEVPNDGQKIEFKGGNITFYNTNVNNKNTYDTSKAQNGNMDDNSSSLNNYSLITKIENKNGSFVYAGDLEGEGQRLNSSNVTKTDVAVIPHHNINFQGHLEFHEALNPTIWTNTFNSSSNPTTEKINRFYFIANFLENFPCPVVSPSNNDLHFKIFNGVKYDGGTLLKLKNVPGAKSINTPFVYKSDPYFMRHATMNEFLSALSSTHGKISNDTNLLNVNDIFFTGGNFINALKEYFPIEKEYWTTNNLKITPLGRYVEIIYDGYYTSGDIKLKLVYSTKFPTSYNTPTQYTWTNSSYYSEQYRKAITVPINNSTSISEFNYTNIAFANQLNAAVLLNDNSIDIKNIILTRMEPYRKTNMDPGTYIGFALHYSGKKVYIKVVFNKANSDDPGKMRNEVKLFNENGQVESATGNIVSIFPYN